MPNAKDKSQQTLRQEPFGLRSHKLGTTCPCRACRDLMDLARCTWDWPLTGRCGVGGHPEVSNDAHGHWEGVGADCWAGGEVGLGRPGWNSRVSASVKVCCVRGQPGDLGMVLDAGPVTHKNTQGGHRRSLVLRQNRVDWFDKRISAEEDWSGIHDACQMSVSSSQMPSRVPTTHHMHITSSDGTSRPPQA